MTVGELIQALSAYPKNLPVLTRGYESGYDQSVVCTMTKVTHYPDNPWYEGSYQKEDDSTLDVVIIYNDPDPV